MKTPEEYATFLPMVKASMKQLERAFDHLNAAREEMPYTFREETGDIHRVQEELSQAMSRIRKEIEKAEKKDA